MTQQEHPTEKIKKIPKLKPKEKEFVKVLVHKNNENITKTVKEVFDIEDQNYANVKGQRLIRKDTIVKAIEMEKETLKSALEKKGITPTKVAETINELLEATDEKGNKDYNAKDKGLKHTLSIYGVEDAEKPKSNATYNFIFNSETQETIKALNETIKAKLLGNV